MTVTVPVAACTDRALNDNTASLTATFLFDTTLPTMVIDAAIFTTGVGVTSISVDVPETSVSPIALTLTFSEAVSGLTAADLTLAGSSARYRRCAIRRRGTLSKPVVPKKRLRQELPHLYYRAAEVP